MNKTTKGALGLGSAAVLLAGGAGSLAYWTDTVQLPSTTITAGSLKLSTPSCGGPDWTYQTGAAGAGAVVTAFVPGDKITKTCTFVVTATGQNLKATLNTPAITVPTAAAGSTLTLTPTTSYTIGSTTATNGDNNITSADNGKTVTAVFNVTIPFGTKTDSGVTPKANENDIQLKPATLNAITVNLTQVTPNVGA